MTLSSSYNVAATKFIIRCRKKHTEEQKQTYKRCRILHVRARTHVNHTTPYTLLSSYT